MELCVRGSLLVMALAGFAGAQTLLEHVAVTGPAATGATAGAMIGSRLGQIMGTVEQTAAAAGKTGTPAPAKPAGRAGKAATPLMPVLGPASPTKQRTAVAPAAGRSAAELATVYDPPAAIELSPVPAPAPLPPPITREKLLAELPAIQPGLKLDQVVTKLGKPATQISYFEGGTFVERVRFRAAGQDVVVVEFKNGLVDNARSVVR